MPKGVRRVNVLYEELQIDVKRTMQVINTLLMKIMTIMIIVNMMVI